MSIPDGTYIVRHRGLDLEPLVKAAGYWVATQDSYTSWFAHTGDVMCACNALGQPDTLGIWTDPITGKVYFDAPTHVLDRDAAITLARSHNQIAIWDCANNVSIPTGGTGE